MRGKYSMSRNQKTYSKRLNRRNILKMSVDNKSVSTLDGFVSNIAKLGLTICFVFYSIGFVIWQSYLARYGLSIGGMFQFHFITAACCYFLVAVIFMLPPALILLVLYEKKYFEDKLSVYKVLSFWFVIVVFFSFFVFPDNQSLEKDIFIDIYIKILVLYALVRFLLSKFYKQSSLYLFFSSEKIIFLFLFVIIIGLLYFRESVDKLFFLITLILYLSARAWHIDIPSLKGISSKFELSLKILTIFCFFIVHWHWFGKTQFGKISKVAGGGRPELAYLIPSESAIELFEQNFNIPVHSGMAGPVAILVKTEKELIFIKKDEIDKKNKIFANSISLELLRGIKYQANPGTEKI